MELGKKYDAKAVEKEVRALWDANKEHIHASLQQPDKSKKIFSWLEGPPTANAPPALHHVEARTYKDIVLRFKHMQGYHVPRKGGWDCHGLPVEVQVEKKLKLAHKKDVIQYGIGKFVHECKTDVFRFIEDWNESTERMAFWVDLDHAYRTLDTPYMESVWWSLKEIHKKGLLYKGYKVVPYCPRCETPLSTHEVAQGYREVKERSVTVQVKLHDEDVHLLVWTTTPWTLPANNSIALNPDIDYCYVEDKGEFKGRTFVLAKELVQKYFEHHTIKKTVKGKHFEGKSYEPIFPYFPDLKNAYRILMAEYVNLEEGTGIVHQASAYGEADYEINKLHNVEFVHSVDREGKFVDEVTDFKGLFVKSADPLIIEHLRKNGKLFIDYDYKHDYPFCWRCDAPLLYYAMDAWFIKVSSIKERLASLNGQISWYPAHIGEGRFGNWIAEAKDWALSRNKFWGTPLPIWVCECGHIEAIGSIEELEKKGKVGGKHLKETKTKVTDLHIMSVDPIKIDCEKCKKEMSRTPEVIDTWYDSGAASFAQFHYPFENKDIFERAFPYDFIVEAVEQTRGWFYTLHVLGTILFDKPAYKSVAAAGLMCDEKGEKMSKSKGNIIKPNDIFDKYGVDATRMVMASYPLGNAVRFGPSQFDETIMPFFNTIWNSFLFLRPLVKQYQPEAQKKGKKETVLSKIKEVEGRLQVEDTWILARMNEVISDVAASLEKHEYNAALSMIMQFVNEDLSRWYIKIIRDRVEDEGAVLSPVVHQCMDKTLRLLAPFAPYITEYLYQDLRGTSIHDEPWPTAEKIEKKDHELIEDMKEARLIVAGILAARDKASIGVRWPLQECVISTEDKRIMHAAGSVKSLIMKQTNVKKLVVKEFKVGHTMKPDYHSLGKTFGIKTAEVLELMGAPEERKRIVAAFEQGKEKVKCGAFTLEREHVELVKEIPLEWEHAGIKNADVYIFKKLSEELEEEGFAREIVRRVQSMRKEGNLEKSDRIALAIVTGYAGLKDHEKYIKEKVGADRLEFLAEDPKIAFHHVQKVKVKDIEFSIFLSKR
jgi:isoleucyl-tRNA synthetase